MAKLGATDKRRNQSRGLKTRSSEVCDWESANPQLLRKAIERASFTGGALRFGYSRDGGTYSIGIYGDGDTYTVYVRPGEELDTILQDVIDLFDSIADEQSEERKAKK